MWKLMLVAWLVLGAPQVVPQLRNHCGPAGIATLASLQDLPAMDQRSLALVHQARLPEYVARTKDDSVAPEVYPDFTAMNQSLMAEILTDRGYRVICFRREHRPEVLEYLAASRRPALIHVPGHYMVLTRLQGREIRFLDPARPGKEYRAAVAAFGEGKPFYEGREGWTGRALQFSRGTTVAGVCPLCGAASKRQYCRECGAWIDQRSSTEVGRALEAIALSARDYRQTALSASSLARLRSRFSVEAWRSALCWYPLEGNEVLGARGEGLGVAELERVVAAGKRWEEELEKHMP